MNTVTALLVADSLSGLDTFAPPAEIETAAERGQRHALAGELRGRLRRWERQFIAANAPATVKAVRSDWSVFVGWCETHRVNPLPISCECFLQFLGDMVTAGRKRATLARYVYTVNTVHEAARVGSPTAHEDFAIEWRGIVRRLVQARKVAPKQAAPLKESDIEQVLASLDGERLHDLRDAALLALASDTLCRESELAVVRLEELAPAGDGENWTLFVGHAKNDQEGHGAYRFVSGQTKARIDRWCQAAGIQTGYLFLPIGGRKKAPPASRSAPPPPPHLRPDEVAKIFRRRALRAGLEQAARVSGHSARVGSAIDLIEGGASFTEASYAGGWKNERMVRQYAKQAEAGSNAMARLRARRKHPA